MVGRVPEVTNVDEPHENADDSDNFSESVAEVVEFTLQRRLLRYLGRDRLVNVANGRLLTREHDDRFRITVYHGGSL